MVKHIVCLKFKDFAGGEKKAENITIFCKSLTEYKNSISVIKSFEIGINSPSASKQNFDVVLITEFACFEDLKIYQNHPEHLNIAGFIKEVSETRAAVDFEF